MSDFLPCFACGSNSLKMEGEVHPYMLASPGCWMMFCEVMNREFSDLTSWSGHQYTVDAYAAQHVGKKEDKRALNSVNIHLAALFAIFEKGIPLEKTPQFRGKFSQHYKGKDLLEWLEPPETMGELTIFDLWENKDPNLHFEIAQEWAMSVWRAWEHQHKRIEQIVNKIY